MAWATELGGCGKGLSHEQCCYRLLHSAEFLRIAKPAVLSNLGTVTPVLRALTRIQVC